MLTAPIEWSEVDFLRLLPVLGGVSSVGVPHVRTGVLGSNSNFLFTCK